jgi:hypothetical protein
VGGNIEDVIALSIRDSGKPLVDLTRDDHEAGPSSTLKGEPAEPRGKPPPTRTTTSMSSTISPAAVGTISLF